VTVKESLRKGIASVGAELAKHWIGLSVVAVTAALLALLRGTIADWLAHSTSLPNWALSAILLLLLASVGVLIRNALVKWRATKRYFRADVTDSYLGVVWRLKSAPRHWVEENIKDFSQHYTDGLLEGPYDAQNNCFGSLVGRDGAILRMCPACGRQIPIDKVSPPKGQYDQHKKFYVGVMKHAVLLGLQQEHLRGRRIGSQIALTDVPYLGSLV